MNKSCIDFDLVKEEKKLYFFIKIYNFVEFEKTEDILFSNKYHATTHYHFEMTNILFDKIKKYKNFRDGSYFFKAKKTEIIKNHIDLCKEIGEEIYNDNVLENIMSKDLIIFKQKDFSLKSILLDFIFIKHKGSSFLLDILFNKTIYELNHNKFLLLKNKSLINWQDKVIYISFLKEFNFNNYQIRNNLYVFNALNYHSLKDLLIKAIQEGKYILNIITHGGKTNKELFIANTSDGTGELIYINDLKPLLKNFSLINLHCCNSFFIKKELEKDNLTVIYNEYYKNQLSIAFLVIKEMLTNSIYNSLFKKFTLEKDIFLNENYDYLDSLNKAILSIKIYLNLNSKKFSNLENLY